MKTKSKRLAKKYLVLLDLLKKTDKLPFITGLATTAALIAVENKKSNVFNLVKKTDYDAIIADNMSNGLIVFSLCLSACNNILVYLLNCINTSKITSKIW